MAARLDNVAFAGGGVQPAGAGKALREAHVGSVENGFALPYVSADTEIEGTAAGAGGGDRDPLPTDRRGDSGRGRDLAGGHPRRLSAQQVVEVRRHLPRRLVAVVPLLLHGLPDDKPRTGADLRIHLGGQRRRLVQMLAYHVRLTLARERRRAREHVEEGRAEGVDVGARVDILLTSRLFRRDVRECPNDFSNLSHTRIARIVANFNKSKIEQFCCFTLIARLADKDVVWFDIAMNHTV